MIFVVYPCRERNRRGYRWRLMGKNNKVVAHGEWYPRKANVERAIERMKQDVPDAQVRGGRNG